MNSGAQKMSVRHMGCAKRHPQGLMYTRKAHKLARWGCKPCQRRSFQRSAMAREYDMLQDMQLHPKFWSSFFDVLGDLNEVDIQGHDNGTLSSVHQLVHNLPLGVSEVSLVAAASADASAVDQASQRYSGFLSPLSDGLERVLGFLQTGLDTLHIPYSYGFSIILLTLFVRTATFPLTKKQVEVGMASQQLKPSIDRIKQRYGDDKERIQQETARLYEMTKINPLAGCLPSLASIPIFLGLYYSLTNVANDGALDQERFLWIPSLAGPTSLAARRAGAGTAWLFPFVDGHPPIGWHDASRYLILPVLLVAMQYATSALITPPQDVNQEENNQAANFTQGLLKFSPLLLGWFSLNVPAGLTLYYFSNISLVTLQQLYLRKGGGASIADFNLPDEKYGVGKRTQKMVGEAVPTKSEVILVEEEEEEQVEQVEETPVLADSSAMSETSLEASTPTMDLSRRCRRKRLIPAPGSAAAAGAL